MRRAPGRRQKWFMNTGLPVHEVVSIMSMSLRLPARMARAAVLGLLLVAAHAAPAWADTVLDGIVVMVNGRIITRYELDTRLAPVYEQIRGRTLNAAEMAQVEQVKKQILDQMIDDILILQDSERYKIKVSDGEVEEQIKEFLTKRKLTEQEFRENLAKQGMTREEFVRNMRRDIIKHRIIGGLVSSKVVVTDTEIENRYKERKAEYSKDSMVQLSLILLPPGMSASQLKADIEAGKTTFAQAADQLSKGPGVGHGGDIGFIAWKDLAPEWSEALAGLTPGQITKPLRIQDYDALLQVMAVKAGEEIPLEAVRDQIYQSLQEGKFEKAFQEYMEKLRQKAVIEYRTL